MFWERRLKKFVNFLGKKSAPKTKSWLRLWLTGQAFSFIIHKIGTWCDKKIFFLICVLFADVRCPFALAADNVGQSSFPIDNQTQLTWFVGAIKTSSQSINQSNNQDFNSDCQTATRKSKMTALVMWCTMWPLVIFWGIGTKSWPTVFLHVVEFGTVAA